MTLPWESCGTPGHHKAPESRDACCARAGWELHRGGKLRHRAPREAVSPLPEPSLGAGEPPCYATAGTRSSAPHLAAPSCQTTASTTGCPGPALGLCWGLHSPACSCLHSPACCPACNSSCLQKNNFRLRKRRASQETGSTPEPRVPAAQHRQHHAPIPCPPCPPMSPPRQPGQAERQLRSSPATQRSRP